MGGIKPGRRQVKVLHLEPRRAGATCGSAFMVLLASGLVVASFLYQTGNWPQQWRAPEGFPPQAPVIAAAVGAFLAIVFFISAMVNGRRWHIARVVERMSSDPRLVSLMPDTAWTPSPQRAADIPSLDVVIQRARKLPKPQARLRPVSAEHNVIGD